MTLVCVNCSVELRPVKTGQPIESMCTTGSYQLFSADRYQCPGCGFEVVSGMNAPIEHAHNWGSYSGWLRTFAQRGNQVLRFWMNLKEKQQYEDLQKQASSESRV